MGSSGFRLQADWHKAFKLVRNSVNFYISRDKCDTVWFHRYDKNRTDSLKLIRDDITYNPNHNEYKCELLRQNILTLSSRKDGLRALFQAPSKSTDLLPRDRKNSGRISCMDVSPNGELLLYATNDHCLTLRESVSGDIRRQLEGHLGEIYKCRFFPSSLAALTAGSDMQLKIWCLLTGRCAATLAPRGAGAACGADDTNREPGGHRSAIMDCGIIERGRNVVSIDRCGWLRLWDVSSQTCISAIPVTEQALASVDSYLILEEVTCLAVKKLTEPEISLHGLGKSPDPWYTVLETSSTKAKEVGTTNKLVAVGCGQNAAVRIFELDQRSKGCVAEFKLPNPTGAIETIGFCEDLFEDRRFTSRPTSTFSNYGIFVGGQNDELACWDIRHTREPLWQILDERGAVHHIRAIECPLTSTIWLFVCRSDGRVVLYPFDPAMATVEMNHSVSTLDLTGIDCEPIKGFGLAPLSVDKLSAWVLSRSGLLNYYDALCTMPS